jgi:hypothetical protein
MITLWRERRFLNDAAIGARALARSSGGLSESHRGSGRSFVSSQQRGWIRLTYL